MTTPKSSVMMGTLKHSHMHTLPTKAVLETICMHQVHKLFTCVYTYVCVLEVM